MFVAKAIELVLQVAFEHGDWLVLFVFPILLHDSASPLNGLLFLFFEQSFACDVVHIFVGEPSSDFFDGQFAWWFTLGLAGFAQLTVGYVVRCDVRVSQHCSALCEGKSAFELGAWFGLLALGTSLCRGDDRSSPLG